MLGFKDDIDKALCRKEASIAHILLGWDFQSGRYTLHTMLSKKYDKLGILHEAQDWVMEVDIDQGLRFPKAVCISTQRPDIVIY